jgi:NAD-dependent DNA ligase
MIIEPPNVCPSCESKLAIENNILYCRNNLCPAQGQKLVENFAKNMKILGLGPASIKKLDFTSIYDIYDCSQEYIVDRLGEALGCKLYKNIENSKGASLNQVLPSLGIPLIGKTAAEKICSVAAHISDITPELATSTLGPVAASNLISWLEMEAWETLPFSFASEKVKSGRTVCITGKLKSFKTKSEAAKYLEGKGYKVVDSITKTTEILVNESGIESEKTKKASANGTLIVNNILEL